MLTNIKLSNVASFNDEGAELENLNEINFIYGNNGTGKTTISNYISNMDNVRFKNCSNKGSLPSKVFVYNQKYLEEVIVDKKIPGIFSLGEDANQYEEQLESLEYILEKNFSQKESLENNLVIAKEELNDKNEEYIEYIWHMYRKNTEGVLHSVYDKVSLGAKNSKSVFFKEFLAYKSEITDDTELIEKSKLISDVDIVFNENISEVNEIDVINDTEKPSLGIFQESIVGTNDVDFGELISSLHIDGWVSTGKDVIEKNNLEKCPLCQQDLTENILEGLANYFDDNYKYSIEKLDKSIREYKDFYKRIISTINEIKNHEFIDDQKLIIIANEIDIVNAENEKKISEKELNPSNVINLSLFQNSISKINDLIMESNLSVNDQNEKFRDRKNYREQLKYQAKMYFIKEVNFETSKYDSGIRKIRNKCNGLERGINTKTEYIDNINKRINEIKTKIEGIGFTAEDLNKQLRLFGFHNFTINPVDNSYYQLIRESGEPVLNTLSEGEKTFITFLYFYHSITKNNEKNKLIVIDDPISSLDSSILYVVSSLLKKLIKDKASLNISQIILSTHNTYFHKEISYKSDINLTNFYLLRKNKSITSIMKCEKNPVTSSYDLLWKELYEYKDFPTSSVPNIMRRILEEYFTFLGNTKLDDLILEFDPDEQIIADSLIKFAHDGSHRIKEDLFVEQPYQIYEKYYNIFEKIFERNRQKNHFDMMVKRYLDEQE